MRAALRFVVPLLLLLGAVAVGASAFMERQAHRWAERDLAIRAQAILHVVRGPLAGLLAGGERTEVARLLDGLVRDERIVAAAACTRPGTLEVQTGGFPAELGCGRTAPPTGEGVHQLRSGPVLVSVLPVSDDRGEPVGRLVLLHDMSYLDRRASVTRWATLLVFCLVALLAAGATILASRLSWTSWTRELRRHLWAPLQGRTDAPAPDRRGFAPVLSDVRELVQRLASEEAGGMGGRWTPERLRRVLRSRLHGEGVVVVANREPYVHERDAGGAPRLVHPASGLVTALEPVMRACSGTWIAHGSGSADRDVVDADDRILVPPGEGSYRLRRLWLSEEEERGYYYGFANEGLWPLCHIAHARPEFRSADFEMYRRVNLRFARAVVRESTGSDPIVLVQDYHFALLPRMLRELLPRATILTFWHTPFPHAERFAICPQAGELLEGMLGSSIVGFHTQAHCNNFLGCVDHLLESRIDRERQAVVMAGRETLVRPYPISIEWPGRWASHAPPVADCRAEVRRAHGLPPGCLLGVGVDRLDYTKGIPERLLAVERLLERQPDLRGRFFFLQVGAPSRFVIEAYRRVGDDVAAIASRVNARFAVGGRGPIVFVREHQDPAEVFRIYRAADVCYVSSLHDGMNLVAKEFVSARDDARGVLVLSRFTGAGRELSEALLVNPYDIDEAANALSAALRMPVEEQEHRMRALRAMVAEFNVYRWAGRMLLDATRVREHDRLSVRLADAHRAAGTDGP